MMSAQDFRDLVAYKGGMTDAATRKALDALSDAVSSRLAQGLDVNIPGVGSFKPRIAAARIARNPRTGEEVHVPPKRTVKFKPAPALMRAL